jgi:hypothetical protein
VPVGGSLTSGAGLRTEFGHDKTLFPTLFPTFTHVTSSEWHTLKMDQRDHTKVKGSGRHACGAAAQRLSSRLACHRAADCTAGFALARSQVEPGNESTHVPSDPPMEARQDAQSCFPASVVTMAAAVATVTTHHDLRDRRAAPETSCLSMPWESILCQLHS